MAIILKHCLSHAIIDTTERGRAPKGTLYVFKNDRTAFLALSDGKLLDLEALLDGKLEREADLKAEISRLTEQLKPFLAVQEDIEVRRAKARAHIAAILARRRK